MSEVIVNSGPAGPDAPEAPAAAAERPAWLPENFKSPEDLVASYKELQGKATKAAQGDPEAPAAETPDNEVQDAEGEGAETPSIPESLKGFSEEFAEHGKLSDESYTKLAEQGYPKEMVDAYIEGVKSSAQLTEGDADKLIDGAGGKDAYVSMIEWAGANLSDEEIAQFDAMVGKASTAKIAIDWLQAKHKASEGFEPTLIRGGKPAPVAQDVFRSWSELTTAQKDPRYKAGDKAYHAMIDAKLARSNLM